MTTWKEFWARGAGAEIVSYGILISRGPLLQTPPADFLKGSEAGRQSLQSQVFNAEASDVLVLHTRHFTADRLWEHQLCPPTEAALSAAPNMV